jgi:hypothetical protein
MDRHAFERIAIVDKFALLLRTVCKIIRALRDQQIILTTDSNTVSNNLDNEQDYLEDYLRSVNVLTVGKVMLL